MSRPALYLTLHLNLRIRASSLLPTLVILIILTSLSACGLAFDQPAELVRTLTGHSSWVNSVAWSRDGKMIAAGSDDTTVIVWDADTGHTIVTLAPIPRFGISGVA